MASTKKVVFGLEAQDNATPKLKKVSQAAEALAAKLKALDGVGTMQGLRRNLIASVDGLRSASAAVGTLSTVALARAHGIAAPQNDFGLRAITASGWAGKVTPKAPLNIPALMSTNVTKLVGKDVAESFAAHINSLGQSGGLQGLSKALFPRAYQGTALSAVGSMAGVAQANGLVMPPSYGLRSSIAAGWATKNPWTAQSTKEIWGNFAKEQMADVKASFASLGQSIAANKLAIAGWATAVGLAGKAALDAAIRVDRLDKAYTTITGDSVLAERQLEFIRQKSNELGLEFFTTAEASRNFFAAMKGTSIEKDANDIFEAVSMAATALSLSETDMEGTFRALGQMISKGKVQAEELRGQLGERLPGAFQFAAKAMGMTTMELDKALERGNVLADEMLPKLAAVLRDEFGDAAAKAAGGLQQNLNRVNTEWERFKSSVLDSETVAATLKGIAGTLRQFNDHTAAADKRKELTAAMERQGIQKMGYEEWEDMDILGTATKKYRIFYTDEQVAEFKAMQDAAAKAKESIVSTQTATEKTLSNASRTIKNYLKDSEESRRVSLQHEYENVVDTINKAIEARKQENKDYSDLVADKAKVDAEYARKRAALDKKYQPKDPAKAEEKKLKQEIKDLDVINDVMTELAEKTGQYNLAVESTNALIEKQAQTWLKAGVPQEYVDQLKEIRKLEASTDGLDKMKLGWREFYTESMNWGTQLADSITGMTDSMAGAFWDMATTGKASFSDLASSAAKDLSKIAARMVLVWTIQKALGWAVGAIAYNKSLDVMGGPTGPGTDVVSGLGFNASGGVFAGAGNLHDYSNSIVSRPTLFTAGGRLPQYAHGAGLMGEAGPEAVMPLTRIGGRLGVDARGVGGVVNNITINTPAGYEAQERRAPNSQGGEDVQISFIRKVVAGDMNSYGSQINRAMRTQGARLPVMRGGG